MTINKPQVGRARMVTVRDKTIVSNPLDKVVDVDWMTAPIGSKKEVSLSDGTVILFEKTKSGGWVNRELTKKERRQQNKQMNKQPKTSNDDTVWCTPCLKRHAPPVHKSNNTTASGYNNWHEHDGLKLVYTCRNGAQLYGASKYGLKHSHPDVVIDMAGNLKPNFIQNAPEKFRILKKYVSKPEPEVLNLDWEDYGTPPVSFRFWKTLLDLIAGQKVTLTCIGGHGRTGTALAALMIADGMLPNKAMAKIWGSYCEKAIESTGQENYLLSLVGQSRAELYTYDDDEENASPISTSGQQTRPIHSVHCQCTECLEKLVANYGSPIDRLAKAKSNEKALVGVKDWGNDDDDDDAWERYQKWARDNNVGKQPALPGVTLNDQEPEVYDF